MSTNNVAPTIPFFQVIRRGPRSNISVTLPINLAACFAGTAFQEATPAADQDASGVAALADGTKSFAGFVTRNVLAAVGGVPAVPAPTLSELSQGDAPHRPYETDFSAGTEASLEDADMYEAEGPNFVSSGNGARDITSGTAVGTRLSFIGGVTCKAASGDRSEFELVEQQTPGVAGNVRIRARRVYGTTI